MNLRVGPVGVSKIAISRRRRRSLLFQRAAGKCFYCGDPVFESGCEHSRDWLVVRSHDSTMTREHMVPTVRGGADESANVVCACRACNTRKAAFTTDEFRLLIALRSGDLNFRFPGESPVEHRRDWLICHSSEAAERDLVQHNMPTAAIAYGLRNAAARGPKARRL